MTCSKIVVSIKLSSRSLRSDGGWRETEADILTTDSIERIKDIASVTTTPAEHRRSQRTIHPPASFGISGFTATAMAFALQWVADDDESASCRAAIFSSERAN